MHAPVVSRPALSSAATLLLVACEPHQTVEPGPLEISRPNALSTYFPPQKPAEAGAN